MASYMLSTDDVAAAVLGGAMLGGGGGGWMQQGTDLGLLALNVGAPRLVTLDELQDDDLLATVALVGAPSAKERYLKPVHYVRAIELLQKRLDRKIAGIMTNENGPGTTVNGWFQAAMLQIPCVDAPCNGRAHPTGIMGSIGLHQNPDYVSIQAAVGGKDEKYVELVTAGSLAKCAALVRSASVEAGGLVAVARNPITVRYAREHCAVGAIRQTIELGQAMQQQWQSGGEAVTRAAMEYLGGEIIFEGRVETVTLKTVGGFDVGTITTGDVELTFWNEYMTLEQSGKRLATFPDLIMTVDRQSGQPLVTAQIQEGHDILLVRVPKERLILGAGMRDPVLFQPVEKAVNKTVIPYVFA